MPEKKEFNFKAEQLNRLFPFFIQLNKAGTIVDVGPSLKKLLDVDTPVLFSEMFNIKRPYCRDISIETFIALKDQLVVLEAAGDPSIVLRGQLEVMDSSGHVFFFGSPWYYSMDQVVESGLTINEFARHDAVIDLLHVQKTLEITANEMKELLFQMKREKEKAKIRALKHLKYHLRNRRL